MQTTPEENLLLGDKAYMRLRELLRSSRLKPGQYVSVQELVGMLDCPLAPTREAVKRAAADSLLRIVPKRGAYVMDVTPELIRNCFELRALIDQQGARLLAREADSAALQELRHAHVQVQEQARDQVTPALQRHAKDVDWRMHNTLAASLKNPLVAEIYSLNREKIQLMQNTRPILPDRIVPAMEEHLRIIDHIAAGSTEKAAEAVHDHFRATLRWWGILV